MEHAPVIPKAKVLLWHRSHGSCTIYETSFTHEVTEKFFAAVHVHIHRSADAPGNTREPLKPSQPLLQKFYHEPLQQRSTINLYEYWRVDCFIVGKNRQR